MVHTDPARPACPPRESRTLDGLWAFRFRGPRAALDGEHPIPVPGLWQTAFAELRNSVGIGTYRRRVCVPPQWAGRRVFLIFEGVFHTAVVRIDDRVVARHANAWTPFEIDVTSCGDAFNLEVDAGVPDDTRDAEPGFSDLLHAKQDWYGVQGGIWKSVRLEARAPQHLIDLTVATDTDLIDHHVTVKGRLSAGRNAAMTLRLYDGQSLLAEQSFAVGSAFDVVWPVTGIGLWSPETPRLYDLAVSVGEDTVYRAIGFRRFEAKDGRLHLNGRPFALFGALDQDWYPQRECLPPTPEFLEQRFANAKELGLNALRCHVKIPDAAYFELADRLGLMVWLDMPYMGHLTAVSRAALVETFEAAVRDHGHHPAVCIWTIANEGWGIELDDNPDDRAWLRATFDHLKTLVPHGLVVDNSACFPRNYHVKTDIEDFHWYNSWPSQNDWFQRVTNEFAARAPWSFTPHGDGERSCREPLICSEFGVWGLPHPADLLEPGGREPWWFESGHDWNNGIAYPHGMDVRFRDAALGSVFATLDGFVLAAQETQFRGLKHQIETLRYAQALSGYVITELNDTQWEANGLMDARNKVRSFAPRLAALHVPVLPVARPTHTAIRAGETIRFPVRATSAAPSPERAVLHWRFAGQEGMMNLPPATSGSDEIDISVDAPSVAAITVLPLDLTVVGSDGSVLGVNTHEFCIVPPFAGSIGLRPVDEAAQALLADLGCSAGGDVLLATRLTESVRRHLIAGANVVVIVNDDEALREPGRTIPDDDLVNFPRMRAVVREGTPWDGRWMGAFSWRRTDGPWSVFPNGPMLDEHWAGLLPKRLLTGFNAHAFAGLVDAGVVVGWIHRPAAFSKRSRLGEGWMTATTFDLLGSDGRENPLAPYVLAALARS